MRVQATLEFDLPFGDILLLGLVAYIQIEVCVPECHFPGTGYFPKKFGKFPVPSIREHHLPM